jgi:peptidoglycan/LPS O-acetylase OafA/YrhL
MILVWAAMLSEQVPEMAMADPEKVLGQSDYANYRNIRAISVLFIILGFILVIGGIQLAVQGLNGVETEVPWPAGFALAIVGVAGAVGGISALRGSRRAARLTYVMAAIYLLAIPVGTILGAVMLSGLSRYLASLERLEQREKHEAERRSQAGRLPPR